MKRIVIISFLAFLPFFVSSQVAFISGSYKDASASGSGSSGLPTLTYTISSGSDRLLIFTLSFERDHLPTNGSNWANPATTGGASPVVMFGGATLTRLRTLRYFHYATVNNVSDATISVELLVYGLLESSIPSGTANFTVSGVNTPANDGDEAVYTAMMFENVESVNYLASSGCESCNAINLASVSPNDVKNMVLGFTTSGSSRTISKAVGYTMVGSKSVVNSAGTYTPYSEKDGMATAAQYISATTASQTIPFSMSGAADISGGVEVGFRLVSPVLLPVELISFSGQVNEQNIELYWETASEINNDYFEIERSSDGFYWDAIAELKGMGSSYEKMNYAYFDENVNCSTCYYRLKQVDFDGSFAYSNVIALKTSFKSNFTITPNPSTSTLTIKSPIDIISFSIYNKFGQKIVENNDVFSSSCQTHVEDLPSGIYSVRIKTISGFLSQQFVKQ